MQGGKITPFILYITFCTNSPGPELFLLNSRRSFKVFITVYAFSFSVPLKVSKGTRMYCQRKSHRIPSYHYNIPAQ